MYARETVPVSVIIGGQYGSEGKGKVAHAFSRDLNASVAIRVGGSNSGHTAVDEAGIAHVFRSLPTAALLPDTICVIAVGAYIDVDVLLREIAEIDLPAERLLIDRKAVLITSVHKDTELASGLPEQIGSTGSGTGAAVISRIQRKDSVRFAENDERLSRYLTKTRTFLRDRLNKNERVLIEGTQGFGLSLLHSDHYPNVTSRDTSAAAFVSEAGLSPCDVDDVIMVIRAFPIRVAGNSGPLPNEIDWETVTRESESETSILEYASVTGKVRRVGRFDAGVVRAAIDANAPTRVVLNHVDYVDANCRNKGFLTPIAAEFVEKIEYELKVEIDFLGLSPSIIVPRIEYVGRAHAR